jgi:hypothetical protein
VLSLEALNRRLWAWVEGEYHQSPPKGLDGSSPLDAWAMHSGEVRIPGPELDLRELFLFEDKRRVQKDRTVSLDGVLSPPRPRPRRKVGPYLGHLLRRVGTEMPLFEPAAVEALFQATQGLPRKINLLAHHTLIAAALQKAKAATADHVQAALSEVA